MLESIWVIITSVLMFFWINTTIYTNETLLSQRFDIKILPDIAFSVVIIFITFGGLKWYCNQWKKISGESWALLVYEKIYIPFIIVAIPFIYTYFGKVSVRNVSIFDVLLAMSLFFILADPYGFVGKYVEERRFFNTYENSENILFLSFPPKSRIDILPIDILYNLLIFIPMLIFR